MRDAQPYVHTHTYANPIPGAKPRSFTVTHTHPYSNTHSDAYSDTITGRRRHTHTFTVTFSDSTPVTNTYALPDPDAGTTVVSIVDTTATDALDGDGYA